MKAMPFTDLRKRFGMLRAAMRTPAGFPNGHPCSPIVSPSALEMDGQRLWTRSLPVPGLKLDVDAHRSFVERVLVRFAPLYDYADASGGGYYSNNPFFGWLDSRALLAMLMEYQPSRIVEIGSGFSSLLMADANMRRLSGRVDITCIDPMPRTEIRGRPGIAKIIPQEVQRLPLDFFGALGDSDFLFIDSSHVCKTGSDVNYLLLEVLPMLAPGVVVHFHDIFIPFEYPEQWVLVENRSWNEQYLLQAFLSMNDAYSVLFGSALAGEYCRAELEAVFGIQGPAARGGSSFWIRRSGGRATAAPASAKVSSA